MTYDDPFFLEVLRCFDQLRSLLTDWSRAKSGGRSRGARMGSCRAARPWVAEADGHGSTDQVPAYFPVDSVHVIRLEYIIWSHQGLCCVWVHPSTAKARKCAGEVGRIQKASSAHRTGSSFHSASSYFQTLTIKLMMCCSMGVKQGSTGPKSEIP